MYKQMSYKMEGLLFEDRWAPVTSEMGFLEKDAEQAARFFTAWKQGLDAPRGITLEMRPVVGSLEQLLVALLPLSATEDQRYLFIPTRSPWAAYVTNGWTGTDASSRMSYMAKAMGCRGLRVVAVPHTLKGDKGRYGAVILAMYGPRQTHWLNTVRSITAANDGGPWVFSQTGEPFPFEKPEQYKARKVRDRFTLEMMKDLLKHLGLEPFQEDFYMPPGSVAWMVERKGFFAEERTLAQARERF